ncbi:hypothetical protein GBF35_18645 [Nonomuraea phyllanthi]|uniref:hypothetical protein n=1 Tax=Nonomuraea phyllanthi TaxID=2219224 RepID=UPI0012940785|nr:hypothetical protein [Nonomuraea phyllanthi]QFY08425.1 hypothetical protein GBF35_18645 [Nonomuraea phyllanthi]
MTATPLIETLAIMTATPVIETPPISSAIPVIGGWPALGAPRRSLVCLPATTSPGLGTAALRPAGRPPPTGPLNRLEPSAHHRAV